jgi:hypothetical protein
VVESIDFAINPSASAAATAADRAGDDDGQHLATLPGREAPASGTRVDLVAWGRLHGSREDTTDKGR